MAEQKQVNADFPGIKKEMRSEWVKSVELAINLDPGVKRDAALTAIRKIGTLIKALSRKKTTPVEVIALVEAGTEFREMPFILQSVIAFSDRGEEFRLWWNEWHDRTSPSDIPPVPFDEMPEHIQLQWNARPKPVFNPWHINLLGKIVPMPGSFDPSVPLTKSPQYLENVNALVKKLKEDAAASKNLIETQG